MPVQVTAEKRIGPDTTAPVTPPHATAALTARAPSVDGTTSDTSTYADTYGDTY